MTRTRAASIILLAAYVTAATGQVQSERFWLAGRYDGNRIIVYFEAVKFNRTLPPNAVTIVEPVADGFFLPVELSASYISQHLRKPEAEHFSLGDQYDLLTGDGRDIPITLTSLVGTEGDEETGNDSYIGALATVKAGDVGFLVKNYYAVRRHKPSPSAATSETAYAHLLDDPLQFNLQSRIVALLTQRMKTLATPSEWARLQNISPRFSVQSFNLANGALRYYAKLDWSPINSGNDESNDILAAWLAPSPMLRILGTETRRSTEGIIANLPGLLNVVDLGSRRTGLIVSQQGEDSREMLLLEYRDGKTLPQMPHLHSFGAGE